MKKKTIHLLLTSILIAGVLGGCAAQSPAGTPSASTPAQESGEASAPAVDQPSDTAGPEETAAPSVAHTLERPTFIQTAANTGGLSFTPSVAPYAVEPDLSNVDNLWQFYLEEGMADKLAQNGFVVCGDAGREFYEIYEINRYNLLPSFVTVDSLMHTYHLYFSYLLKNIERDYLADAVSQLGERMLASSAAQYEQLAGTEWENAAMRNVAFFGVGAKLLDDSAETPGYAAQTVLQELDRIRLADDIYLSEITGDYEDYSQYIPRGYYEGDARLTRYFQAMMWYGRIHFSLEKEELTRSALLITQALCADPAAKELWDAVYAVTSFFAGASDDMGVCEYAPLLSAVYGDAMTVSDLPGKPEAFQQFLSMAASLPQPRINSIPIVDGEENVIPGFRFMGQRFTIDAAIMQKLVYSNVGENSAQQKRMLPDVLDVPAALGSDSALEILAENGATDFAGYTENMNMLREGLSAQNTALWSASLYAGWLNTLRPLLESKGEGYPFFMQSPEWDKKNLECFAGSFTELKHDTVLYAKQVLAEMGGGWDEEPDFRGYVEPEPLVYTRFLSLADQTAQGLSRYGMLSDNDAENLSRLSEIAATLLTISEKELRDEVLTDGEYEFIQNYGGNIEHFWYETVKTESDSEYIDAAEYPAALVVDIATDPNGSVLEAATGDPSIILVAVKVDGRIKIARGSVYSFYQFSWPLSDRLTDVKWRQMMGIQLGEDETYSQEKPIQKPDWTASYRYRYEWE